MAETPRRGPTGVGWRTVLVLQCVLGYLFVKTLRYLDLGHHHRTRVPAAAETALDVALYLFAVTLMAANLALCFVVGDRWLHQRRLARRTRPRYGGGGTTDSLED